MKNIIFSRSYACILIVLTMFAGCSTSELVDIWSDTPNHYPSLSSVLVVSAGTNRVQRRIWEDAFCVELTRHYVDATPSYKYFPDTVPDTGQVIQSVHANGFHGLIVIQTLPEERTPEYTPGYGVSEQTMHYDRRHSRFITYYRNVYHAGSVDSQIVSVHSIDIWSMKDDGLLIWSALSRTDEPNSSKTVPMEIAQLVMTEITQRGIIASRR
ncbi:MAG: hypothetical protein WCW35_01910 [Bacteroidota bacterium]